MQVTINIENLDYEILEAIKLELVRQQKYDDAGKVRSMQRHIEEIKKLMNEKGV